MLQKQRSMIGSYNGKIIINKLSRLQEELKKESHKTSLFRVEFRENVALLACF